MKAKNLDTERFLKMIGDNQGILFKVCLMFSDRHKDDIRDLYNDIVCALWEGWPTVKEHGSANAWLYRVAFNTAIDKLRRDSRRPLLVSLDEADCEALEQEASEELAVELYRLADRLKPDEKALLRLYLDRVKQLVHFPIGGNMFVNGVMVHADDSAQWDSLVSCFASVKQMLDEHRRITGETATDESVMLVHPGDSQNPERWAPRKDRHVDHDKSCVVFFYPFGQTFWIFHYATEKEYDRLLDLYIDKLSKGKMHE